MVKSVIYTLTAIVLCVALFVCVELYLNKQFDEFGAALDTLYKRSRTKPPTARTATR